MELNMHHKNSLVLIESLKSYYNIRFNLTYMHQIKTYSNVDLLYIEIRYENVFSIHITRIMGNTIHYIDDMI